MANGLNRLEKLFSKRKASVALTTPGPTRSGDPEQTKALNTDEALFPPPSFLRPKGARMVARDESAPSTAGAERAQSLPEAQSERVSIHSPNPSTASTGEINGPPTRSASLMHRRKDLRHIASLHDFKFPMPPTRQSTEMSPVSPTGSRVSPRTSVSYRARPLEHRHSSALPRTRLHTPPASDHEDDSLLRQSLKTQALGQSIVTTGLPTPAASPEMKPATTSSQADLNDLLANKRSKFAPLRRRKEEKAAGLRRVQSHANFIHTQTVPLPKTVLKGVDVTDFFDLDDEDLAEEVEESDDPVTPVEGLSTDALTGTSPSSKRSSAAGIISDPISDTAAHGAVQVARIAAKHKFDLVYIVNLWPEKSNVATQSSESAGSSRRSSATSSLLGSTDGTVIETASGMTGRLLAAYGLSKVASPFRISAAVHAKILRHESWIEYRSGDATQGEFSLGYGHAFHASRRRGASAAKLAGRGDSVSIEQPEIDSGVVFAAYRQPGADGKTRGCTQQELEELHADAEYLIDMLIDIHKAKRRRDPGAHTSLACDVGPMPAQAGEIFS